MENVLKAKILQDLKDSMRAGDTRKRAVVGLINAAIKNEEINARVDARAGVLSDGDILGLIRREIKQHEESLLEAKNANRADLIEEQEGELVILRTYLPQQLSREAIIEIARGVIATSGAKTVKDQGIVMKGVLAQTKDQADGKLVSEVVKSLLI